MRIARRIAAGVAASVAWVVLFAMSSGFVMVVAVLAAFERRKQAL